VGIPDELDCSTTRQSRRSVVIGKDGWNRGDLKTTMAPFGQGWWFSSPGISMLTGDPSRTTIEGYDELPRISRDALRRAGDVDARCAAKHVGTDSSVLFYACGLAESVRGSSDRPHGVDGDRRVFEWRRHY